MLEDLIVELDPPPNRQGKCVGVKERHLTEAAVMLAYGMHLLQTVSGLTKVELHPDGEHAKRFEIARWLNARGFSFKESHGATAWCGTYANDKQEIVVTSIPGKGDVVALTPDGTIVAECKGGIVNTRHPGQVSRLRKGLCEAVGLLMATSQAGRQVAVVPYTETTLRLAQKMAPRAKNAGIEIALMNELGQVIDVEARTQ